MRDFRKLKVWQKAHETILTIYQATMRFPAEERFGLASQMRRAGVSIGSNIAEGAGRGSDQDFARFLRMSFGSASELEYQILLSKDHGYITADSADRYLSNIQEVRRFLSNHIPSCLSFRPPSALRKRLNSSTIRPLPRLEDERKFGAIWYVIFRQSPKTHARCSDTSTNPIS